jgi:succinyl-CoA synthetase beta subunit/citryl-CoA synthetase large subunit
VKFVKTPAELTAACEELLGRTVGPYVVNELLIEQRESIAAEYYVALSVDTRPAGPEIVALASHKGGTEIEAAEQRVNVVAIDLGHHDAAPWGPAIRDQLLAKGMELRAASAIGRTIRPLYQLFRAMDCDLLEINPLAMRPDGQLVALGVVLSIDDAAAERHRAVLDPDIQMRSRFPHAPSEKERAVVQSLGDSGAVRYVELDGDVGYIVIGGGASLYCLDRLTRAGLRPACYMDVSPGRTQQGFRRALEAAFTIPNLRAVIGGAVIISLLKVDEIAAQIVGAMEAAKVDPRQLPVIMRWAGPGEEQGQQLLRSHGIQCFGDEVTLDEFIDRAVAIIRQGNR